MPTVEILKSHTLGELRKEVSKTNIKRYSKLKKIDLIELMMKKEHLDLFHHMELKTHKMPSGIVHTGSKHTKDSKPVEKKKEETKKKKTIKLVSFEKPKKKRIKLIIDPNRVQPPNIEYSKDMSKEEYAKYLLQREQDAFYKKGMKVGDEIHYNGGRNPGFYTIKSISMTHVQLVKGGKDGKKNARVPFMKGAPGRFTRNGPGSISQRDPSKGGLY